MAASRYEGEIRKAVPPPFGSAFFLRWLHAQTRSVFTLMAAVILVGGSQLRTF